MRMVEFIWAPEMSNDMHLIFCSFAWKHLLAVRREFNCVSDVCRLDFFYVICISLIINIKVPSFVVENACAHSLSHNIFKMTSTPI